MIYNKDYDGLIFSGKSGIVAKWLNISLNQIYMLKIENSEFAD
jgi:hypothetical protein